MWLAVINLRLNVFSTLTTLFLFYLQKPWCFISFVDVFCTTIACSRRSDSGGATRIDARSAKSGEWIIGVGIGERVVPLGTTGRVSRAIEWVSFLDILIVSLNDSSHLIRDFSDNLFELVRDRRIQSSINLKENWFTCMLVEEFTESRTTNTNKVEPVAIIRFFPREEDLREAFPHTRVSSKQW